MKILYAILILSLIAPAAMALEIGASVTDVFTAELRYFNYNDTYATKWFEAEVFNTGSLAYTAQARIEIANESGIVFTGWSDKKAVMPGSNAFFRVYWRPSAQGSYTARVRIYHSGEILDKVFNITATPGQGEDVFSIKGSRTFRNILELKVESSADVNETVIIPDGYPKGWAFSQSLVKEVKKGEERIAYLPYTPSVWSEQKIYVDIASTDGKYFSRKEVQLRREEGLGAMIHNILFSIL
jgi:hypothetical protein